MAGGTNGEFADAVDWFASCADMLQAMKPSVVPKSRQWLGAWAPKLLGLLLLAVLVARLDLGQLREIIREADLPLVVISVLAIVPLIFVKTIRWQGILRSQSVQFQTWPAFLAYFGSLFVGFLTPGRLGEFVKAMHVSQDCGVSSAQAFSSVLADRLFDLHVLLLVGGAALLTLTVSNTQMVALTGSALLLTLPLVLFLNDTTFGWLQQAGLRLGHLGRKLLATGSWLPEMRLGLRQLRWSWLLAASALTVLAYTIFFGQCYLLALALGLNTSFVQISFAVTLGSLMTLLPISISGLGTREAAIVAYLGTVGVPYEAALGFSLLVFATFYVAGGLMGAVAWWMKPIPLDRAQMSKADAGADPSAQSR